MSTDTASTANAADAPCVLEGRVVAVAAHAEHAFSKPLRTSITLLTGLGVEGDAHCGRTVQHRSRVAQDPSQPNLRQVHLLPEELFAALAARGLGIREGDIGENITTRSLDLLALPADTLLHLGPTTVVRVTGLRNPCAQLDHFRPGLLAAVLDRDDEGRLVRKAGVMAVVVQGGIVRAGDAIRAVLPAGPYRKLDRV